MGVVSGDIPNFINGVSEQPFQLRLASQAEEQINGLSTVAEGLVKRPPTVHVARLGEPVDAGTAFTHIINRDASERYAVVIAGGNLFVYSLIDGTPRTVNYDSETSRVYLSGTDYAAVTVADYTILSNRGIATQMLADTWPVQQPLGLIYVRQGVYAANYAVELDNQAFIWTTPAASDDGADASQIQTDFIAEQLRVKIVTESGGAWAVVRHGSTLGIAKGDGTAFQLAARDSYGDTALICIKEQLQSFADLPARATSNFQVAITGTSANAFDNYYVQFRSRNADYDGVWVEAPRPGRKVAFDANTMPHALVRESDGSFTFKALEWDRCGAGDETTCPEPSFVGQPISDVSFQRNRLCFLSGEQVVFSRSAKLFNFWRETATALLDTDPIDLSGSHTKVSMLRYAVPFNEELLLFSDEAQFILSAPDVLTPKSAAITLSTEFLADVSVRPAGAGSYLYFSAPRGQATSVHEYYVDGVTRVKDAEDVTEHVPHYIPAGCHKLAASKGETMVAALTWGARNLIYVYKVYRTQQQKVQSAWSRWVFGGNDTILNIEFLDSSIYVLVQRPGGLYLERIDLDISLTSGDLPYAALLDRRLTENQVGVSFDGTDTTLTTPGAYPDGDLSMVVCGNGPVGLSPELVRVSGVQFKARNINLTGMQFRFGLRYEFLYDMSPFVVRKQSNTGGANADLTGRTQVHRLTLNYADTGYFQVIVTPVGRNPYTYTFVGRTVGMGRSVGLETGGYRVPVMAQNTNVNISIRNGSHIPCRFLTATWEGQHTTRSRSLG